MSLYVLMDTQEVRRSPQGERGLKCRQIVICVAEATRRSPQGERGLKYRGRMEDRSEPPSLSARRAWIEIGASPSHGGVPAGRSPQGERGLKSVSEVYGIGIGGSLSARRAWIEM